MKTSSARFALWGLVVFLVSLSPSRAFSQDVILQGFYWNTNPGDISSNSGVWWDTIAGIAPYLQNAGFETVWTPPANKGFGNVYDMGYGVYDYYDFGEFNQKGSIRTRHGNKAQLQSMISALHGNGIKVMADLVLNHRGGGDALEPEDCNDGVNPTDAWTDFNPASGRLPMDAADFHPNFTHCDVFAPYHDRLFFEDLCYFNFLDQTLDPPANDWYFGPHNLGRAGDSLIVWGRYLLDEVGFDEVRLDAVKHIEPGFLAPFLVELATPDQPFAVGELFDGNLGTLVNYRNEVENFVSNYGIGSKDANLAIFDFNLRYALRDMCNGGGGFNMWNLNSSGLLFGGGLPGEDVVTFVENHDVDRIGWQVVSCATPHQQQVGSTCLALSIDSGHDPVLSDKEDMGYPYIMAAEGRPTVFWKDLFWYGLKEDIEWQMALREATATGGSGRIQDLNPFFTAGNGGDLFVMNRYGTTNGASDGLVLALNDNPSSESSAWVNTPFSNKYLKDYSDGYLFVTTQAFADSRANVKAQSRDYAWWSVTGLYPQLPGATGSHFQMDAEPGGCPHFIALRAADAANLLVNGAPIAVGDEVAVKNGAGDIVGIGRIGQSFQWDGVHDMIIEVLGAPSANGMNNGEQFSFVVYDASASAEVTIGYVQYATAGSTFTFSPDRANSPNRNGNFSTFNLTASATGLYTCGGITRVLAFGLPVVPLEDLCGAASQANAGVYDNDGNQIQNGDNDGARFLPWTGRNPASNNGNAGLFNGNSATNGDGDGNSDGDINTGGEAWGFYANSSNLSEAIRPFSSPLSVGQTFTIYMDNGWINNGGTVGLGLRNSSNNNVWEFFFVGGQAKYQINASGGVSNTSVDFTDEGLRLDFLLTSSTTWKLTLTQLANGNVTTYTGTLMNPAGGSTIDRVRLFNFNAGPDGQRNAFFNSMQICDSPALVINEVDYEQPGADNGEFVELRNMNTTAINLDDFTLQLVNGTGDAVYENFNLPNVNLAAGDYYVVCLGGYSGPECDLSYAASIQNGAPDAVRLMWNGVRVDALSYEGDVPSAVEGSGTGLLDPDTTPGIGLSRVPDGSDTDQNNVDFELTCITPGAANAPDNTDTDNDGAPDGCDDCPLAKNQGTIPNFNLAECACNQGYYAVYATENGQQVIAGCQPCPPGFFCPDGLSAYSCQIGEYSSASGAVSCQNCPTGTYSGVLGAAYCETCEPGSEAPSQGSSSCENCDPPSFSSCPAVTPVNSTPGQCDATVTVPSPVLSGLCTRNHALNFDGVNDYVDLGATLGNLGIRTIEMWFKLNADITPTSNSGYSTLISRNSTGEVCEYALFFSENNDANDGKISFSVRAPDVSNHQIFSDQNSWTAGTWYHVAAVIDGATGMKLYINGVLQANTDPYANPPCNTNTITALGRWGDLNIRHLNGALDEVRVWNVARSQSDIQAAMNVEINPTYPGLIAFYNFNQGIACCNNSGLTTLTGGMPTPNNGTLSGFSLASGCTSNWVAGAPALGDPLTLVNDVTGNCSSASGTYPVGTTSVTWTATGANGQTATCTQIVTVNDNQAPAIACPSNITQNTAPGLCTAAVTVPQPTVSDNCGPSTGTALAFDGTDEYVLIAPVAGLAGTDYTIEGWFKTSVSGVNQVILDGYVPSTTNSYLHIMVMGIDGKLRFLHRQPPGISGGENVYSAAAVNDGNWHHFAAEKGPDGKIRLYLDGVLQGTSAGTVPDLGGAPELNIGRNHNLDWYFNGQLDEIRIWNTARPATAIACGKDQLANPNDPGLIAYYRMDEGAGSALNDISPNSHTGTLQNMEASDWVSSPQPANYFFVSNDFNSYCDASGDYPAGTTNVGWTVTDAAGNPNTCDMTVTVVDNEAPALTSPGNQNLNTAPGLCMANYTIADPVSDNCTGATWGYTLSGATTGSATGIADGAGSGVLTFNQGVTTVELSATDGTNSAATVSFTVTVTDNQMPAITCPANIVANTGVNTTECTSLVDEPADLLTTPGVVFPNGPVPASGTSLLFPASNPPNQIKIIIPVIPAGLFQTGDEVTLSFNSTWTRNGADNDVRWMFADGDQLHLNGIFLIDNDGGTVARSQTASSPGATIAPFNLDNPILCGSCFPSIGGQYGADVTLNVNALGQVTISGVMFGDGSGNTAVFNYTYTGTFDVAKGINFLFVNENSVTGATTQLDELDYTCDLATPSACGAIVSWSAPTASDNCSATVTRSDGPGDNANLTLNSGDEFPLGLTTICYQATDADANSSECCFTVTVLDNSKPDVTCPANTAVINTDAGASCQITIPDYVTLLNPTDNCTASGSIVEHQDIPAGAYSVSGDGATVTVNYTATDGATPPNTTTCTVTITVIDNQPPAITCPSNISVNNDPGQCCAVVNYTAPIGTDNCTGQSTAQTAGQASGFCFPLGVTTNTFVVTDAANLTASCSFTVTVTDSEIPVITLLGDASLVVCADVAYIDAGATAMDNCDGDISANIVAGGSVNTSLAGVYVLTYDVMDAAGNPAVQVSRTVTVVDPQAASPGALAEMFCSQGTTTITVALNADSDAFHVNASLQSGTASGYTPSQTNLPGGSLLDPAAISNTGGTDAEIEYTITPYHYGPDGQNDDGGGDDCTGPATVVTITVKPEPVGTNKTYKVCSGTPLSIDLQGLVDTDGNGVQSTFSWVAANNAEVDGENSLPTAGSVINNQLSLVVPANGVKTVVYTVSPTGQNGCVGD
ncbi:MAG: LamG-like jellyroll fold domain-containing protein, partial [Saprospiraceae bacterium]